jgi:hypothetical protein
MVVARKCTTKIPSSAPRISKQEFADALAEPCWFKRGWTLQELIALSSVEFYNRNWAAIGNKTSLSSFLEEITSIPAGLFSPAWYNLCAGGLILRTFVRM